MWRLSTGRFVARPDLSRWRTDLPAVSWNPSLAVKIPRGEARRGEVLARRALIGDARSMHIAGALPLDTPDPRDAAEERLAELTFPVMGLEPQAAVEDARAVGFTEGTDETGPWELRVSISYTFWRNPDDREDPVNLVDLDEQTRVALDTDPAWPRPAWVMEMAQLGRHPMLWEAVQTSWHRDPSEHTTLARQLVAHTNHILVNRFREELGLQPGPPTDTSWQASEASVRAGATLEIDGIAVPALEIDTDPFVYAIGAPLDRVTVATVVLPREYLPNLLTAIATRNAVTHAPKA